MTDQPRREPDPPREYQPHPTTPAEEWGDRTEVGRGIARGGKEDGSVPSATGDDPADAHSDDSGKDKR